VFNARRSKNSWFMVGSAVVGGFLLGVSYKKYGKDIKHRIQSMARNSDMFYGDYTNSHEPDA